MLELPYPPTVNHYYTVARGRKILSKKGRQYKKDCKVVLLLQPACKRHTGEIAVKIHMHVPDRRKRDCDNILKPVLDVLVTSQIIADDSNIVDLRIVKFPPVKGGSIKVWVESWAS